MIFFICLSLCLSLTIDSLSGAQIKNNKPFREIWTALKKNDLGQLAYLIHEYPCLIMAQDHLEQSLLTCASRYNQTNIAHFLAKHFKKIINHQDCWGYSALHYAAEHGNHPLITTLIEQGAQQHLTTCNGDTALHLALIAYSTSYRHHARMNNLITTIKILKQHKPTLYTAEIHRRWTPRQLIDQLFLPIPHRDKLRELLS